MSTADLLQELASDIGDCYYEVQSKGGTVPQNKNTNNLATAIGSIPSGVTPTGEIAITENGTYDVTNYASASVSVAGSQAFRLIPANVTVENGSFSLEYEGTPPNVNTASIIETVEGTNQTGLSYSVSYSNGTATFTLVGTASGVVTAQTNAVVKIGDTGVVIGVTGLPVKYNIKILPTSSNRLTLSAYQKAADYVLNFENYFAQITPSGVSPSVSVNNISAFIIRPNGDYFEKISLSVSGFSVTIPANTVQTTATLVAVFKQGSRTVLGSIVLDIV